MLIIINVHDGDISNKSEPSLKFTTEIKDTGKKKAGPSHPVCLKDNQ